MDWPKISNDEKASVNGWPGASGTRLLPGVLRIDPFSTTRIALTGTVPPLLVRAWMVGGAGALAGKQLNQSIQNRAEPTFAWLPCIEETLYFHRREDRT